MISSTFMTAAAMVAIAAIAVHLHLKVNKLTERYSHLLADLWMYHHGDKTMRFEEDEHGYTIIFNDKT